LSQIEFTLDAGHGNTQRKLLEALFFGVPSGLPDAWSA
jgi:hypothetical protein